MLAALARLEPRPLRSLNYSSKKERQGPSFAIPSRGTRWLGSFLVIKPGAQSGDLLYGTVPTLRYSAVSRYQGCDTIQLTGLRSFRRQREEQGLTGSGRLAWRQVLELVASLEPCPHRIDYPAAQVLSMNRVRICLIKKGVQARVWCLEESLTLSCSFFLNLRSLGGSRMP